MLKLAGKRFGLASVIAAALVGAFVVLGVVKQLFDHAR